MTDPHCYRCGQSHWPHQDCIFGKNGTRLPTVRRRETPPTLVKVIVVFRWAQRLRQRPGAGAKIREVEKRWRAMKPTPHTTPPSKDRS